MELGKTGVDRTRLSPDMVTHMIRLGQVSSWIIYDTRIHVPWPAILGRTLQDKDQASGAYVGVDYGCSRLKMTVNSKFYKSHARVCYPSLIQYCNVELTYRTAHPR